MRGGSGHISGNHYISDPNAGVDVRVGTLAANNDAMNGSRALFMHIFAMFDRISEMRGQSMAEVMRDQLYPGMTISTQAKCALPLHSNSVSGS